MKKTKKEKIREVQVRIAAIEKSLLKETDIIKTRHLKENLRLLRKRLQNLKSRNNI